MSGLKPENQPAAPMNCRKLLNGALAINDLKQICQVIDGCITGTSSVTRVATAAGLDRTTLYRAFRLKNGPSLDTALRVIKALGYRVIVIERGKSGASMRGHSFTRAIDRQDMELFGKALEAAFRQGNNFAEVVAQACIARETIYRLFAGKRAPRFGTVLACFDVLVLQFLVVSA